MRKYVGKRGLSPVIATVLLISLALLIAIIIFLWARSFVDERAQKFDEPIEKACEDVDFEVEAIEVEGKIYIENVGNVAVYGVEVRKKESGAIYGVETLSSGTIGSGESGNVNLPSGVSIGDEIVVVPVILGEIDDFKKAHTCDEDYGIEIIVE